MEFLWNFSDYWSQIGSIDTDRKAIGVTGPTLTLGRPTLFNCFFGRKLSETSAASGPKFVQVTANGRENTLVGRGLFRIPLHHEPALPKWKFSLKYFFLKKIFVEHRTAVSLLLLSGRRGCWWETFTWRHRSAGRNSSLSAKVCLNHLVKNMIESNQWNTSIFF